jgi:hypothetical protein
MPKKKMRVENLVAVPRKLNDLERPEKNKPKGIFSDTSPAGRSTQLTNMSDILALTKTLQLFAEYFDLPREAVSIQKREEVRTWEKRPIDS